MSTRLLTLAEIADILVSALERSPEPWELERVEFLLSALGRRPGERLDTPAHPPESKPSGPRLKTNKPSARTPPNAQK